MNLRKKVPVIAVLLCASSLVMIGVLGYVQSRSALQKAAIERLSFVAETKRDQLKRTLESNGKAVNGLARSESTRQGIAGLQTAMNGETPENIRAVYQPSGSTPADRARITGEGKRDLYSWRHAGLHAAYLPTWSNGDYTDAYVILASGAVAYTVTKSDGFLANIDTLKATALGRIYDQAMGLKPGEQAFLDFTPYDSGSDTVSAFWAQPVYPDFVDEQTKPLGVVVMRMSANTVDKILAGTELDGTVQDNFLAGADGKLRSNRVAHGMAKALEGSLPPVAMQKLSEKAGYFEMPAGDRSSENLITAYQPLQMSKGSYFVLAAQAEDRVLAAATDMRNGMVILSLVALAVFAGISIYLGTLITSPINALAGTVKRLADGDLAVDVPGLTRTDELAEIAKAVEVFKERAKDNERLRQQIDADRVENDRQREQQDQLLGQAIGRVVASAAAGNFSERIETSTLTGVAATLGNGINSLLDGTGKSLTGINTFLDAMAHGDLTQRMDGDFQGVFARLQESANQTAGRLSEMVRQIASTASNVKEASSEISTGSQDLASRTEQQAAALEETAASMHEITSTVKQNAGNAEMASRLADAARSTANQGGTVAQDAVRAMGEIEQAAQKISDIVGLIDEIAFQTNLLALNASVEAARAGEAGKGFAVVAQEVRGLAQRSANASKDIKELIQTSNNKVRGGSELVQKAGSALDEIMLSVKKVADIVTEISAASGEQATGLDEVSRAVANMDEMTQRNGALVEETTASAQALAIQADQLHQLVAQFKI